MQVFQIRYIYFVESRCMPFESILAPFYLIFICMNLMCILGNLETKQNVQQNLFIIKLRVLKRISRAPIGQHSERSSDLHNWMYTQLSGAVSFLLKTFIMGSHGVDDSRKELSSHSKSSAELLRRVHRVLTQVQLFEAQEAPCKVPRAIGSLARERPTPRPPTSPPIPPPLYNQCGVRHAHGNLFFIIVRFHVSNTVVDVSD